MADSLTLLLVRASDVLSLFIFEFSLSTSLLDYTKTTENVDVSTSDQEEGSSLNRKRKARASAADDTKIEAKREYNRLNAIRVRQRKKELVEHLKSRCRDLEKQVKSLEHENSILKAQAGVMGDLTKNLSARLQTPNHPLVQTNTDQRNDQGTQAPTSTIGPANFKTHTIPGSMTGIFHGQPLPPNNQDINHGFHARTHHGVVGNSSTAQGTAAMYHHQNPALLQAATMGGNNNSQQPIVGHHSNNTPMLPSFLLGLLTNYSTGQSLNTGNSTIGLNEPSLGSPQGLNNAGVAGLLPTTTTGESQGYQPQEQFRVGMPSSATGVGQPDINSALVAALLSGIKAEQTNQSQDGNSPPPPR